MGEIFRRWRHWFGVLVLIMALVAMGGWVRSWFFIDSVVIRLGVKSAGCLWSGHSSLYWQTYQQQDDSQRDADFRVFPQFFSRHISKTNDLLIVLEDPLFQLRQQWIGFGFEVNDDETTNSVVPYWFVVLSLTLISAILRGEHQRVYQLHLARKRNQPAAPAG